MEQKIKEIINFLTYCNYDISKSSLFRKLKQLQITEYNFSMESRMQFWDFKFKIFNLRQQYRYSMFFYISSFPRKAKKSIHFLLTIPFNSFSSSLASLRLRILSSVCRSRCIFLSLQLINNEDRNRMKVAQFQGT